MMRTTECFVANDNRSPVWRALDLHSDSIDVLSNVRHVTSNDDKMAAVNELSQSLTTALHQVT